MTFRKKTDRRTIHAAAFLLALILGFAMPAGDCPAYAAEAQEYPAAESNPAAAETYPAAAESNPAITESYVTLAEASADAGLRADTVWALAQGVRSSVTFDSEPVAFDPGDCTDEELMTAFGIARREWEFYYGLETYYNDNFLARGQADTWYSVQAYDMDDRGQPLTDAKCRSRIARVEKKVAQALSWIPKGASDVKKAQILHDYLVRKTEYENKPAGRLTPYTAYGALVNRKATCNGYSWAFQLLASRAGLRTVVVVSEELNHAWNAVEVRGVWYNVDATWDDYSLLKPSFYNAVYHTCFLKSTKDFNKTGHKTSTKRLQLSGLFCMDGVCSLVTAVPKTPDSYKVYKYPNYGGPDGKIIKINPNVIFSNVRKVFRGSNVRNGRLAGNRYIDVNYESFSWVKGYKVGRTYRLVSVPARAKKFIRLRSNGLMTVKKGLKKGTYRIRVRARTRETAKFRPLSRKFTVKVIVR